MVGVYDQKRPDEEGRGPAGPTPRGAAPEKTVGVYDRPKKKGPSSGMLVVLAVALIVALLLVYRFAYGCQSAASIESAAAGARAVAAACEERAAASERIG